MLKNKTVGDPYPEIVWISVSNFDSSVADF